MNTNLERTLLFYTGALLILLPACKKNDLEKTEIVINARVPDLTYSNSKEIELDGTQTSYWNRGKVLFFNWTCPVYPTGMPPAIVEPTKRVTKVNTLAVGKYVFVLTVKDDRGNSAQASFNMEMLKDTLLPVVPKVFAGPDQSFDLPKNVATLDGYSSYDKNPLGRNLEFYWTVLSQPSGTQTIVLASQSFDVTSAYGFKEGFYQFQLRVTNEFGLYADDTIGVTVRPDPLAGTTKVYENLEWKELEDDWDYIIGLTIDGPTIFPYRNLTNMELRLWDETRQVWGDPHTYWESWGNTLRIYTGSTNYQLLGKSTKAQVRFF